MLMISLNNPKAGETMMVNVYPYAHYVFQFAVCVTAWLTVSVAMDRYVSVCHPSRAKGLCTIVRARSLVGSIFIVMAIISIPSAFRYRLHSIQDPVHNKTCMELVVTEFGRNEEFMIPYTWAQNFFRGIIPVFILIFLNLRIINVLRKERVKGKKFNSRNRITLMLIAMILVFIICISPDAIMSTFFGKGYVEEGLMVKGIREITDSLLALNSAVNFILYCSLSNQFRQTFCKVFLGKRYVQMRGGSCRQVSNYEPTTMGNNGGGGGGCEETDCLKGRKGQNDSRKSRLSRRGMTGTGSEGRGRNGSRTSCMDSPDSLRGLIDGDSGGDGGACKNGGGGGRRERNNSLCYADHNDHLYAEMSGVWLGPAPKSMTPISTDKTKSGIRKLSAEDVDSLRTSVDVSNVDDVVEEEDDGEVDDDGECFRPSSEGMNTQIECKEEDGLYSESETADLLNMNEKTNQDYDIESSDVFENNDATVPPGLQSHNNMQNPTHPVVENGRVQGINGHTNNKCVNNPVVSKSNGDIYTHSPVARSIQQEHQNLNVNPGGASVEEGINNSGTWNASMGQSHNNKTATTKDTNINSEPRRSLSTDAIIPSGRLGVRFEPAS